MNDSLLIRREGPADIAGIRQVNLRAFEGALEADVIDQLRDSCPDFTSLVAVMAGEIVGHILFTPATLEWPAATVQGMGLAPLSVHPEYQRQGIGSSLVRAGLAELQAAACPFVIVLGHPQYYPRFSFEIAARYNIRCEYPDVPEEAFMIRFLAAVPLPDGEILARYRPEWAVTE
jgi:putative acetyltransferase